MGCQLWFLNNTIIMMPRRLLLRALITTTTTTLSAINLFFRLLFAYSQLRVEISYLLQHASGIHCYYIFQLLITCNRGDTASGTYGADQIYSRSGRIPQRATSRVPCALQDTSFPRHWTKRTQECERRKKNLGI